MVLLRSRAQSATAYRSDAMIASGNDWLQTDLLGQNEKTWKITRRTKSTRSISPVFSMPVDLWQSAFDLGFWYQRVGASTAKQTQSEMS